MLSVNDYLKDFLDENKNPVKLGDTIEITHPLWGAVTGKVSIGKYDDFKCDRDMSHFGVYVTSEDNEKVRITITDAYEIGFKITKPL